MGLKFYSQNVRGLNNKVKRRAIFKNFRRLQADIICLQETYCTENNERFWSSEWGARALYASAESNSKGVAIFFKRNLSCKILRVDRDPNGRFLIVTVKLSGKEIVISNVYAPNDDKPEFFETLFKHLHLAVSPQWLIGGDFNLVFDALLDRRSLVQSLALKRASVKLKYLMESNELVDIWRLFNVDVKRFTYHGSRQSASRIDFFLLSQNLIQHVNRVDIIPSAFSDHSILFLEIELFEEPRGRGLWRLNTKWLLNKEYNELMNKALDDIKQKNSMDK